MPIGLLCSTTGTILSTNIFNFTEGIPILDFIEGLLVGIAIPLLLSGIYYTGRSLRNSEEEANNQQNNE